MCFGAVRIWRLDREVEREKEREIERERERKIDRDRGRGRKRVLKFRWKRSEDKGKKHISVCTLTSHSLL